MLANCDIWGDLPDAKNRQVLQNPTSVPVSCLCVLVYCLSRTPGCDGVMMFGNIGFWHCQQKELNLLSSGPISVSGTLRDVPQRHSVSTPPELSQQTCCTPIPTVRRLLFFLGSLPELSRSPENHPHQRGTDIPDQASATAKVCGPNGIGMVAC